MGLFAGKKGIVMGVANDHSIAWAIAHYLQSEGADLGFNHLPDKDDRKRMERRVRQLAEPISAKLIMPCDVAKDDDVKAFFARAKEVYGTIDFLVHSVAFAPIEDIRCPTLQASRNGFHIAMDISVYSLIAVTRAAVELMPAGGTVLTMTYFGGEKVVAGYNLMGVCKAALDCTVRYLAYDLGPKNIRVNGISAGPMRTLAASAVGDFDQMLTLHSSVAPLGRNVEPDELGKAAAYLLSDLSSAITGEIHHVDCGYSTMGSPGRAAEHLAQKKQ
ncbi:MAG: enoyl-ACP reductase [Planctomycetes bacterium]|nr:enoyl-ACP reductase [Planctomycetota bacterium]